MYIYLCINIYVADVVTAFPDQICEPPLPCFASAECRHTRTCTFMYIYLYMYIYIYICVYIYMCMDGGVCVGMY